METITVHTQEEFDALPGKFEKYTKIQIAAAAHLRIIVRSARENSSVEARENSSVEAWGNSSVVARGNSSVVAWGNSSVVAWENSSVVAWGNSSVEARGNNSVEAWGNSRVVAWENSSVEARENSSVVAGGNSSVEAGGNSSVVARGNSVIRLFNQIKKLSLKKFSVAISVGFEAKCEFKAETARLIHQPSATYDKNEFLDIHAKNVKPDGRILLYKVTRQDGTDHHSGEIAYCGKVTCPDWDPNPERQCGGGLHLSPTEREAKSYHSGKVKKCLVHPDDFVVYPHDITKVRCREVEVIDE